MLLALLTDRCLLLEGVTYEGGDAELLRIAYNPTPCHLCWAVATFW